jgi:hypothetical protein
MYTPSSRNEQVRCSRAAPSRRSRLNLCYSLKGEVRSRGSLLTWPGEKDATWTWGEVSFQLKHPHLQVWIQVYLEQGSFLRWNNAKISQKKNHWSSLAHSVCLRRPCRWGHGGPHVAYAIMWHVQGHALGIIAVYFMPVWPGILVALGTDRVYLGNF